MADDRDDVADSVDTTSSPDRFTAVSRKSWISRLGEALAGVVFGIALIAAAVGLLVWNEGRAVQTARSLAEGRGLVIAIDPARVDPANDGKLVHISGDIRTTSRLADAEFGVATDGLRLVRTVEMYQWTEETQRETRKSLGGAEETHTTYTYSRGWSDRRIDSSRFHRPDGHHNPEMRYRPLELAARDATLGAFRPGAAVLSQLAATQSLRVEPAAAAALRGRISGPIQVVDGSVYLGADPAQPRLGDLRISFRIAPQGPASIVGRQSGRDFVAYQTKAGDQLLMVKSGTVSAAAMFESAADFNRTLTWILRAVGGLLMWIGFLLILRPLVVVGDLVPLIGDILGAGAGLVALLLTLVGAPLVIAASWLWYRPLVSIVTLAVGLALAFGLKTLAARRSGLKHPGLASP